MNTKTGDLAQAITAACAAEEEYYLAECGGETERFARAKRRRDMANNLVAFLAFELGAPLAQGAEIRHGRELAEKANTVVPSEDGALARWLAQAEGGAKP